MSLKQALLDLKQKVTPNQSTDDLAGNHHQHPKVGGKLTEDSSPGADTLKSSRNSINSTRASIDTSVSTLSVRSTPNSPRTRSPGRYLREKLHLPHRTGSPQSPSNEPLNRDGEPLSRNQERKREKQEDIERRRFEETKRREEILARQRQIEEEAERLQTPEQRLRYGFLPVNNYARAHDQKIAWSDLGTLNASSVGSRVTFRARIHHFRKVGNKLVFFLLRQRTHIVQGILEHGGQNSSIVSEWMLYWAEHQVPLESVVIVTGTVQAPKAKQGQFIAASVKDAEILIDALHIEGRVREALPFSVYEAEATKTDSTTEAAETRQKVNDRARWANRVIDLRTTTDNSIFKIQSAIGRYFRAYLESEHFVEIHTPKLQGGATESGASVFKLDYFGRKAFLAQSPQLEKQMAISADFNRVYEIGAVFRAENSNTHRHLTEYTGLDLEMVIHEHYHEVLHVLDNTFKYIFENVYKHFRHEIETVKLHFPHEDLVWLDKTPVLPFKEAIKMLNETGWTGEDGEALPDDEDLGTRDEIQLGRVVKEKYGTDYYILDKFPTSARPFYAMDDPEDPKYTNSFDIFLRGQEILSGGQRIHDGELLIDKMEKYKVEPRSMQEYVDAFNWGCPPHGGGGIGLERMLMLLLSLGDIRHASMFPRDPKSFPYRPPIKELRHPEASTMHPPWEGRDREAAHMDFQPIEKLIANYGDATNTSWLEPRTHIWRDPATGAAVGYVPQDSHHAIVVGNPLCEEAQQVKIISSFLRYVKQDLRLKPLWLLVGHDVEEVLATKFNWRTFSVAAEQRLDPSANPAKGDADVQRKIRHAEKEGVRIFNFPLGGPIPDDVREGIEGRIKDWLANRKGKQVHLTNIHPWQDIEHRIYHYSLDRDGQIAGLVVMAQLSAEHGWQVKYSLDFPGAPSGAIEMLVLHALGILASQGCTAVTFGGGASSQFTPGHNMKGAKVKVLSKMYKAIANELHLTNKSEFREKLGAEEDPVYVCYPPHGMGPASIKAIMGFFEDQP